MVSLSPTATPLPKSSVAPESPSKDAQTVPFPSPQTFEIIPPLHDILQRLLSQKNPTVPDTSAPDTAADAQPQDQGDNHTTSQDIPGQPSLNVKSLPTDVSSVKIRIQKARTTVEGLPDVHRSVMEQQKEISELEERVSRLKSVIADFGHHAGQAL